MTNKERLEIAKLKLDIEISQVTLDEQRHPWRKISLMQPLIAMVVGIGTLVATSAISVLDHQDRRRGVEKQAMQVTETGEHTQRQLDGIKASSDKIQMQLEMLQKHEFHVAVSTVVAPPTDADEILASRGRSLDPQLGNSTHASENAIAVLETKDPPPNEKLMDLYRFRVEAAINAAAMEIKRTKTHDLPVMTPAFATESTNPHNRLTGLSYVQGFHRIYAVYDGRVRAFDTDNWSEIDNSQLTFQNTALDVAYMDAIANQLY